jgi:hypothetical protein
MLRYLIGVPEHSASQGSSVAKMSGLWMRDEEVVYQALCYLAIRSLLFEGLLRGLWWRKANTKSVAVGLDLPAAETEVLGWDFWRRMVRTWLVNSRSLVACR